MKAMRLVRAHVVRSAARKAARAGNWQTAVLAYRQLVAQGGATSRDMVQLGHCLKEAGDTDAAAEAYRAVAAAFPRDFDAQLHHGLFLQQLRRDGEATNVLARTLAMDPGDVFVRAKLVELGVGEDALDAAMLTGVMAGYDVPRPRAGMIVRLVLGWRLYQARRHARAQRWTEATRQYRRMLSLDPDDPRILVQLGHLLRRQGDAAQAVAVYRRALVVSPRHVDIYLHLGHALKALGRRPAARQAYLAAVRLQPDLPPAVAELQAMGWRGVDDLTAPHPIFDVPAIGNDVSPRLVVPVGLTRRQRSIWMLLAARAENGK